MSSLKTFFKTKLPATYSHYLDTKMRYRYRALTPSKVQLPQSEHAIFTNWREPRGRAILQCWAQGQPELKLFWQDVVTKLQPDIVIDCGVNYGEFLFLGDYKPSTRVIGIEADRRLMRYLEKSHFYHKSKAQIELHCAIASDKLQEEASFFVDTVWSGRSFSAEAGGQVAQNQALEKVQIKSITIDSLFSDTEQLVQKTLFFKIDVEGFEPLVMRGMVDLLAGTSSQVGFVEFNATFFKRANSSAQAFLSFLEKWFSVYLLGKNKTLISIDPINLENLSSHFDEEIITDLVLFSDEALIDKLGYQCVE